MNIPSFHASLPFRQQRATSFCVSERTAWPGVQAWGAMPHCSAGPSPRIFIYDIPRSLLSRPTPWRLVYDVGAWIRKSPHWERHGDCADYFFVPMHPENMINGRMTGDASFARLYAYIRETWPYWNRTVDAGTARHFHLLPCDHGPGDCGYGQLLAISFSFATIGEQVQEHVCRHALPARAAGLDAADHLL